MDGGVMFPSTRGAELEVWGLVLLSHDRIGGSYKKMRGAGKRKSCRDEGGLLLLLLYVEKKSTGHG